MSSQLLLPRPGDVIANRYRVDALIGRGGMGAAYSATNLVTGKRVALKWILREQDAGRLHRLLREACAASRIRHPNIVDVYDVGEHDGALFLVMELLSGQSLQALIDERAPLSLDQVLHWMLPVLRGVRAAHREGVIHRDLKPANVFLCSNDRGEPPLAKVLDFGVCKLLARHEADDAPSLTDSGTLIGTPSYMAPEQLQDARNVDERADIYACGAMLYHALSGHRPFEADSYASLVVKVLTTEPPSLAALRPDLPAELCAAIHRAMQTLPDARFASVDDLLGALAPFADPAEAQAHNIEQAARARASTARSALLLAAIVVAIVGFGLSLSRAANRPETASAANGAPPRDPGAVPSSNARAQAIAAPVALPSASYEHAAAPVLPVATAVPEPRDANISASAGAEPHTKARRPTPARRTQTASRARLDQTAVPVSLTSPQPKRAEPEPIIELGSEEF